MDPLEQWLADAVDALGIGGAWSPADRDLVLNLARDVAHGVTRPAAPLTTYLAGIAVARGMAPADAADRIAALVATRRAGVTTQDSGHSSARAAGDEMSPAARAECDQAS